MPEKLFESKIAHGKTCTADTLNQTRICFLLQLYYYRQGVYKFFQNRLEKAALIIKYV